MTDWRLSYWTNGETGTEHAERVEAAEKGAKFYFDLVTGPAHAAYRRTLRDQAPYLRSPRAERAKADGLRLFRSETEEASRLFEETAEMLMRDGEVSEAMSERWDALQAVPTLVAAE